MGTTGRRKIQVRDVTKQENKNMSISATSFDGHVANCNYLDDPAPQIPDVEGDGQREVHGIDHDDVVSLVDPASDALSQRLAGNVSQPAGSFHPVEKTSRDIKAGK